MPERRPGDEELEAAGSPAGLPTTQLLLAGLLSLQIRQRQRDVDADNSPPEVALVDLGMTIAQVARLSGRKYETVKSTIRRARARSSQTNSNRADNER